ncbi:MAG TPA: EAL domain-containing protein, partial [Dietzia sp.]|nr:EAL domain-containing protein [Dietzia sp.]
ENMADGDIDSGIVRSIVDLAEGQGMRTVAEFVSDERILSAARLAGITYAQGSHIGMSLPLDEFLSTHLVDSAVGVDMEDR